MTSWKGLDSGGTEQLWEYDKIQAILRAFSKYEPVDRSDQNSPIYSELEAAFPDTTWKNTDKNGSFRPIFRKSDPTAKLGLTKKTPSGERVTSRGYDLLSGLLTIEDVFIQAARDHHEHDGKSSFAIIAAALISAPLYQFSLEEIEYGICQHYDPTNPNITFTLSQSKAKPKLSPTRRRRLRHMMSVLQKAGAAKETHSSWQLNDRAAAIKISEIVSAGQTTGDGTTTSSSTNNPRNKITGKSIRKISSSEDRTKTFEHSPSSTHDPEKRTLLLEKANSIHENLVLSVGKIINDLGGTPTEDPNSYDVGLSDFGKALFEVKSTTHKNAFAQFRKAVSQLSEYRWRHRDVFDQNTLMIIVTDNPPSTLVDEDYINYLIKDRLLTLAWQDSGELVCHTGQTLSEVLIQNSKKGGFGPIS